jgi:hypothetical protein
VNNWSDETTDDPLHADERNFYKVEKWTKDGTKVDSLLYAGNNLDKARKLFAEAVKHRPAVRLTIRQRTRGAYGRPAQSVELDLKLTKNLEQMTLQELQELRERYAAVAVASPALVIDHDSTEQPEIVVNGDDLSDNGEAT